MFSRIENEVQENQIKYREWAEGYAYIPCEYPLVSREVQPLSQALEQQALFSNLLKHNKILKSRIQTFLKEAKQNK